MVICYVVIQSPCTDDLTLAVRVEWGSAQGQVLGEFMSSRPAWSSWDSHKQTSKPLTEWQQWEDNSPCPPKEQQKKEKKVEFGQWLHTRFKLRLWFIHSSFQPRTFLSSWYISSGIATMATKLIFFNMLNLGVIYRMVFLRRQKSYYGKLMPGAFVLSIVT